MIRRAILPAGICLSLAIAGCGGSSTETTRTITATSGPTKAQFISEADAICRAGRQKLAPLQSALDRAAQADQANDTAANRAKLAVILRSSARTTLPVLAQLRALTPPAADRAVAARYLAGVASQIALIDRLGQAVARNDQQQVTAVSQLLQQGKDAVQQVARNYGFKACGSGA
jgi:hypothetical protein